MKTITNPYLPSWEYVPDGEPHVFGDRLYVFGSHDRFGGKVYCENDYVLWSAPVKDLSDWHCHGIIYRREQDPHCKGKGSHMWAPDVAKGPDGRFYMYYGTDFDNRIGVAVSEKPEGPYEYCGEVHYADGTRYGGRPGERLRFDPAVLADDDGKIWLYTGFCPTEPWFQTIAKKNHVTIDARGSEAAELEPDMLTIKTEPIPLLPGKNNAEGTGFEGHEFYEASSMRKFDGRYYAIYSSFLSHELAWAVSNHPNKGFIFGGTLHSNGNILSYGQKPSYFWGNNHGSIEKMGENYYVFGHRQTNCHECSRQGVAELLRYENGRFFPAEMTSQGLYGKPLPLDVTYEAGIACVLYGKRDACKTTMTNKYAHPYITQSGTDREENPNQYVANIRNGTVIGYKYFDLTNADSVTVTVKGLAHGRLLMTTSESGATIGEIPVSFSTYQHTTAKLHNASGVSALYFRYEGIGRLDLMNIKINSREA